MPNLTEFTEKRPFFDASMRAAYIIIPLLGARDADVRALVIDGAEEIGFDSDSLSDLVRHKCREGGFVRRFRLPCDGLAAAYADGCTLHAEDAQLVAFENGVGFLAVFFRMPDAEINRFYNFVNPSYLTDRDAHIQLNFIRDMRNKLLAGTGFDVYVEGEGKELALKEAYLFNAAFTDCRFDELETLDRATFNAHKVIRLGESFTDDSETDIDYVYGGRDVENKTYRWGCCISSQSISFVYGPSNAGYDAAAKCAKASARALTAEDMAATVEDDLLLTFLALYQKYTCLLLNERVSRFMRERKGRGAEIREIKRVALTFRAYGTVPPSQISRWNNVCDIYRHLLKVNGVDEAMTEVEDSIALLNDEQERLASERQGYFATILAVFGLVSIVAAAMQIVAFVTEENRILTLSGVIFACAVSVFLLVWLVSGRWNRH